MKGIRILFAILTVTAALPVTAGTDKMQPGLWEYSTKMEMPGMPPMPPMVAKQCMTQQDLDKKQTSSDESQKNLEKEKIECQTKNLMESPGKVSYDLVCTGKHAQSQHIDIKIAANAMEMVNTMDMGGQKMKTTTTGKRVGDCK